MPLVQVMEKLDSVIATLVLKMKEIVMIMMSVKIVLLVDQIMVQPLLVLTLKSIVVIPMVIHLMIPHLQLVLVPIMKTPGKVITFVMMKTTFVDVNGMEETVVVMMLTHNTVQSVNV